MKHLKRYKESFNQSDYYNEISQPEIDKLPTLLSIEEIRELKDKIKDLIGSDYKDLGTKFTYYHTHLQNLQEKRESFIILYEEKKYPDSNWIQILKYYNKEWTCLNIHPLEDEWFFIELRNVSYFADKIGRPKYFKCDQWEGFLKFLQDNFIIPTTT